MRKLALCLGGVLSAALAAPAVAEQVVANNTLSPYIGGFTLTTAPYYQGLGGVQAGQFNFTKVSGGAGLNAQFPAFCMELQLETANPHTYTILGLTDAPVPNGPTGVGSKLSASQVDNLQELWGGFFGQVDNDATKAAAFQLAVWEIIYETSGTWNVGTGGSFAVSGNTTAISQANGLLSSIATGNYSRAHLVALSSPTDQDMITVVPLPAAAWLGMALLGGVGGVGSIRRRLQRA